MAALFLIFEESPYCFPHWVHWFTSPSTVDKSSLFSTCLPALVCSFIVDSHSDRCEVIFQCGFLICIFLMASDVESFHMSMGHLYVLFGKVSVQVLCCFLIGMILGGGVKLYECTFLSWIIYFVVNYRSPLYLIDTNLLSDINFQWFFPFMSCLLTLMIMLIDLQKSLIKVQFISSFVACAFDVITKNHCQI